jgi:hypothetical protein
LKAATDALVPPSAGQSFFEISQQAAAVLAKSVGRGGAQADYESDGKVDIAVREERENSISIEKKKFFVWVFYLATTHIKIKSLKCLLQI